MSQKRIVERGGILIGDLPDRKGERASVHVWKVDKNARGRGIGGRLLASFERAAIEAGASGVQMLISSAHVKPDEMLRISGILTKKKYERNTVLPSDLDPVFFKRFGKKRKRR